MAAKDRVIGPGGTPLNFSCGNAGYRTNINKGHPHGEHQTLGSVLERHLIASHGNTLWLEYVEEISTQEHVFWLMWYDGKGIPIIPMSGVFDIGDLKEMVRQLARCNSGCGLDVSLVEDR